MSAERKAEDLYPRAPRYTLELGDNQIVRFAHMPKGSKAMHTRILNLSESGMAFLVPFLSAPQLDERIKVEFTAPNSESIACFAKVVRVQVHRTFYKTSEPQTFKLIAIEFQSLHPKQREMLAQGISKQFKKQFQQYKRDQAWNKMIWFFLGIGQSVSKILNRLFPFKGFRNSKNQKDDDHNNYIDI